MSTGPVIRGVRTRLRPVEASDLQTLRAWRNAARESFLDASEISPEAQARWFAAYQKRDNDLLFIIETADGLPIGAVGLNDIDHNAGTAEFGRLMIGDSGYAGLGLARDASEALIAHATGRLGLRRLYLRVLAQNERAAQLYASLGFVPQVDMDEVLGRDGSSARVAGMSLDLSDHSAAASGEGSAL